MRYFVPCKKNFEGKVGESELVGHSWHIKGTLCKRQAEVWKHIVQTVAPGEALPDFKTLAKQLGGYPSQVTRQVRALARKKLLTFPSEKDDCFRLTKPPFNSYIHWIGSYPLNETDKKP
jgi:hypothetical protein